VTSELTEKLTIIGQLIAVASAVAALVFVGWQIKQARKAADFSTLKDFLRDVKEHQDALLSVAPKGKEAAFVEFMNFLKIYALALDQKLVPKVSRKLIAQTLCESVACLWNAPNIHHLIVKAYTSPETFENLIKFAQKNEEKIEKLKTFDASC
jgi:uncharacterized membrane protein YebE (DUF533 family)